MLNLVDYSVSGFPLLFVALLELIAISYIYGYPRFSEDIKMMLGFKPNVYWMVCWLGVSPLVVGVSSTLLKQLLMELLSYFMFYIIQILNPLIFGMKVRASRK